MAVAVPSTSFCISLSGRGETVSLVSASIFSSLAGSLQASLLVSSLPTLPMGKRLIAHAGPKLASMKPVDDLRRCTIEGHLLV